MGIGHIITLPIIVGIITLWILLLIAKIAEAKRKDKDESEH